jgi:hypothetical protein
MGWGKTIRGRERLQIVDNFTGVAVGCLFVLPYFIREGHRIFLRPDEWQGGRFLSGYTGFLSGRSELGAASVRVTARKERRKKVEAQTRLWSTKKIRKGFPWCSETEGSGMR